MCILHEHVAEVSTWAAAEASTQDTGRYLNQHATVQLLCSPATLHMALVLSCHCCCTVAGASLRLQTLRML
jgi:NAD-dependent oxidoreductase involved in siderophore biosynthesis